MGPPRLRAAGCGVALAALVAGACRGPSGAGERLPPGPGLVTEDATAPAGSEVHERPAWRAGDRFVYRKAERVRIALRVVETVDGSLELVDEDSGRRLFVGPDQLERGQTEAGGEGGYRLDPGDQLVAFPLWAGKRWASQYVSRAAGRADLPLVSVYHCDGTERVTVPAGSFDCLRVWRRVRVAAEGDFPERVALLWYAPEAGTVVRRLDDGLVTELVELHRQG